MYYYPVTEGKDVTSEHRHTTRLLESKINLKQEKNDHVRVWVWAWVTQTAVLPLDKDSSCTPPPQISRADENRPQDPSMRSGHQMQMLNLTFQSDPRARTPSMTHYLHSHWGLFKLHLTLYL